MSNGMPMVNAISLVRRIWDQNLCYETIFVCVTLMMNNMQMFFNLNEILSTKNLIVFMSKSKF
jgi:hypothetical protein